MIDKIRIAITKGRLLEKSTELFERCGYNCEHIKNPGRRLILPIEDTGIEVLLAKSFDVITYVEHGVCDIGIVGKDTISETGGSFYEMLDLGIGKCKFILAAKDGVDFYGGYSHKIIATKYPNIAKRFAKEKNMDVEIIKIEGSVELAPLLGLSDAIIDITETGRTLVENGLSVIEDIMPISARVIVNIPSAKIKNESITEFISRLKEVL